MITLLTLALGAEPVPAASAVPFAEGIVEGRLENGLRWYILPEEASDGRAAVRLQIDVGAVDEAPEQEGAAHFLEHMSFETSRRYTMHERAELMRGLSVNMGEQWGASTSAEYTTWYASVPLDQPGGLRTVLGVVADQVIRPRLLSHECDHEREIVLEELRMRQGTLSARLMQAAHGVVYGGSLAERDVGGRTERVALLDCSVARRFWAAHYAPERAILVVVGAQNTAGVRLWIEEAFGSWKARKLVEPQAVARSSATGLTIQVEPTALLTAQPVVMLVLPGPDEGSPERLREVLAWDLARLVLHDRLLRLWYAGDPLLSTPVLQRHVLTPGLEFMKVVVSPGRGEEAATAVALWREASRLAVSGLSETELERTKSLLLHTIEAGPARLQASSLADALTDRLAGDVRSLPPAQLAETWGAVLPQITVGEVQEVFRQQLVEGQGRGIVLLLPPDAARPDAGTLRAALAAVGGEPLPAPADVEPRALYDERPAPKTLRPVPPQPDLGVRSWDLGNGLVVHLKTTQATPGQVYFDGLGEGRTSALPPEQLASAYAVGGLLDSSGVGRLGWVELEVLKDTTGASINPYLNENHVGIEGGAPAASVDTLLQMLRAFLEDPHIDEPALAIVRDHLATKRWAEQTDPEVVGRRALYEVLTGHALRVDPSLTAPEEVDLSVARAWARRCFERPARFELFFAGDITPEAFEPLLATWLATLPAGPPLAPAPSAAWSMVKGPVLRELEVPGIRRAEVFLAWHGRIERDRKDRARSELLSLALQSLLWYKLRQDQEGVYHVSVDVLGPDDRPDERFIVVHFVCAPERAAELAALATKVTEELHERSLPADFLGAVTAAMVEKHEADTRSAEGWAVALWRGVAYGEGMQDVGLYGQTLQQTRAADLQALAAQIFVPEHRATVIVRPGK